MITHEKRPEGEFLTIYTTDEGKITVAVITAKKFQLGKTIVTFDNDVHTIVALRDEGLHKICTSGVVIEKHNRYFNGKVQSLQAVSPDVKHFSLGVVETGIWNFEKATTRESVRVLSGEIVINGQRYNEGDKRCVIPAGQEVVFAASLPAAYLCYYDSPPVPESSF